MPSAPGRSGIVPIPTSHRCGKCQGCQRTLDCQTCDVCLDKLRCYGTSLSPNLEGIASCMLRRCRRTCRIGCVDSLLGTASSAHPIQSKPSADQNGEQGTGLLVNKSLPPKKSGTNPEDTSDKAMKDPKDSSSKTMKPPWDDGDDWTVDYSYLSEPEYRRHWGTTTRNSDSKKSSLSTRTLSTPSWWLPSNAKQTRFEAGGRTSLSSISGSVASQKRPTRMSVPGMRVPISVSKTKKGKGRGRSAKRKKDPLHGIALPSTSADACSVTSWRENRKCLRALMEYDEADQDWV